MVFLEELFGKYQEEMRHNPVASPMTEPEFHAFVTKEAELCQSVCMENAGVLLYSAKEREGVIYCSIPVFGYYATDEKTLSLLFERLAERLVKDKTVVFSVSLYAHDDAGIRLFSMLQFGIITEKGVRRAESNGYEHARIRELSKDEMVCRWEEVWGLTAAIVNHLKQSPVFYPGKEFTEALYRDFYMDENTKVFGAFADDGAMIGMIESNAEHNLFAFANVKSVNIGEAYVLPEYRACGLAKQLLLYAETHSGTPYSWLEHGTANPNARGFWGKYYTTYQYTMIREIKSIDVS